MLSASSGSRPLKLDTTVHVWKALTRPILEYGGALWCTGLSQDGMQGMERVQTRFAKRLLTLMNQARAVFARSELGLQSMASRGLSAALTFFGKLVRMPQTRLAAHI